MSFEEREDELSFEGEAAIYFTIIIFFLPRFLMSFYSVFTTEKEEETACNSGQILKDNQNYSRVVSVTMKSQKYVTFRSSIINLLYYMSKGVITYCGSIYLCDANIVQYVELFLRYDARFILLVEHLHQAWFMLLMGLHYLCHVRVCGDTLSIYSCAALLCNYFCTRQRYRTQLFACSA